VYKQKKTEAAGRKGNITLLTRKHRGSNKKSKKVAKVRITKKKKNGGDLNGETALSFTKPVIRKMERTRLGQSQSFLQS